MPAPAWKANGAWVSAASGQITPVWPTHVAGDVGLLLIESGNWPVNVPTRSGFREVPWSPQRIGPYTSVSSTNLIAYWCRATSAAMASPVIDTPGGDAKAAIITFSGVGNEGVPWMAAAGAVGQNSASVVFPGLTTPDADALIVAVVSHMGNGRTLSAWANAGLTGVAERMDFNNADGGVALATGTKAVAGAVGATTATLSVGSVHSMLVLALSPIAQAVDRAPVRGLVGTVVESATAAVTPAWPTHVAGDIGILIVESGQSPIVLGNAQGFVEVTGSPQISGAGGSATALAVYTKRATDAAQVAPTVNFGADHVRAVIVTVKDAVAAGDPIEAIASGALVTGSANLVLPSVTTFIAGTLVLGISTNSTDVASKSFLSSLLTNTGLESASIWVNDQSIIGNGSGIIVVGGRMKDTGATGQINGVLDASSMQSYIVIAFEGQSNRVLIADTGSFLMTGQPAGLLRSLHLAADTGVYAMVGQDVTFSIGRRLTLSADTGQFICSPGDVVFTKRLVDWVKEPTIQGSWVKEPRVN